VKTEDLAQFGAAMHDAARAMRAKLTEADVASYYEVLIDQPLAAVLSRLRDWQMRPGRRWFPTASQLRSDDPDEAAESAQHGERYTPQWWNEVHATERRIAESQGRTIGVKVAVDEALAAAEREVEAAARGLALHENTDEGAAWDRRYQRASLIRDRVRLMSRVTTLRALPAAEDEQVNVARAAFVQFLLVQAERAHRQLIEFYSDDDPFEVHDERVSR